MRKHATLHHKTAVRHPRAGPAPHGAKAVPVPVRKAAVATMPAPTMTVESPKIIEVMELDFTDPDILLDEDTVMTGFDDEDF